MKVIRVNLQELGKLSRRPPGYDFTGFEPIRAVCPYCGRINWVDRAIVERYRDFDCDSCGGKTVVPFIIPDPACYASKGNLTLMFYLN